ncbi:hypothetical protein PBY51_004320 [Eleginops maclovinus]|uniref:Uncharacterized protein n=1 Tax=Eleginops maclovinus TaxID=56733 RepID=A0AAN8AX03_ELEMC|nr:hypothetical protein PBY51_004320 [Eleginops maclovinus]
MTGPDSALTQAAWCHAHQLLPALPCHKSPAGGNESLSVRAGCTSWHRHHLTSRSHADSGAAEIKKNEAWRQTEPYPCALSLVSSGLPPH